VILSYGAGVSIPWILKFRAHSLPTRTRNRAKYGEIPRTTAGAEIVDLTGIMMESTCPPRHAIGRKRQGAPRRSGEGPPARVSQPPCDAPQGVDGHTTRRPSPSSAESATNSAFQTLYNRTSTAVIEWGHAVTRIRLPIRSLGRVKQVHEQSYCRKPRAPDQLLLPADSDTAVIAGVAAID
jgi:hypothetical protein